MKATLEFNLPEDEWNFEVCNRAVEMNRSLGEIQNLVRGVLKYEELTLERATEVLEQVRQLSFQE